MNFLIKKSVDNIKLNFMWIKIFWKALRKDSTLEQKSVTLLNLNEDCLRHIGYYLSIEDTYSLGHTCTQLFGIVSKIRATVWITILNEMKYLNYFGPEARTIIIDMLDSRRFTKNEQRQLLVILEKCTKMIDLTLRTSNSRILGGAFVGIRSIRKLAYLRIYLMNLSKFHRPNFVESMRNCENLRGLFIEYDDNSRHSYTVKKLFATEFPKLKFLNVDGRLSEEYLEAIVLFQKLEKIELTIFSNDKNLIPKLLILNKLPVLEYTKLTIYTYVTEQMAPILQQIQSLKELSITCTLFEYFISDIFQIRQITSLTLIIEFYGRTFSEIIKQLRYHEQSLSNLTNLDLSDIDEIINYWTTSNDLNEFIKFIINCPRIKSIEFPNLFPIHRLYKRLLKYEKNFGYHVRKKALHLTFVHIPWIPGYSNGRRTHNVIIENENGDETGTSISKIIIYAFMELFYDFTSVLLCLFFMLIGKLIHVIQKIIV